LDSRFANDSETVIQRLSSLPGVRSVAATVTPPLGGSPPRVKVRLEGETLMPSDATARTAEWYAVSPGYFDTLEVPLIRGRDFDAGDRSETRPVAIIDAAMAERFWPGEDPLGQLLQTDMVDAPLREVVGVVGNVRQDRYQSVPQPQLYVPRLQVPPRMDNAMALRLLQIAVVLKTDQGLSGMEVTLRAAIREAMPSVPVSDVRAVEEYVSGQIQDLRRATFLLSSFGVIAVILALIGIFGVVTHLVSQRRVEIGIRMALGARSPAVLLLILRQGVVVIVLGLILGAAGALALTRLVRGFLYGVTTTDPTSFAAAMLALTATALLACYFPARRASRIEPVIALKNE
jgi:putative ABC transport system permease protein